MLSRLTSTYINKYKFAQPLLQSSVLTFQSRLVSSTPSLLFIRSFSSSTTTTTISSRSMSTLTNGHANGTSHPYDYDLIVIGGGSGGLAASKEAAKLNPKAKIAVLDYVQPTVYGTRWGLGGTCVNVGCVPKKLMHYASLLGSQFPAAEQFGWMGLNNSKHEWGPMVELITNYIKSLNFSYRSSLRGAGITYIEAYGTFTDPHTLAWTGAKNKKGVITGNKFLIATGGRPNMGTTLGKELAISSDDLFWLKKNPGKTLVIGAGYIALECAGFLHHIGNDISVMVRGEFMRKFDKQSGQQIGELMERSGIRFTMPATSIRYYKKKEYWVKAPEGSTPGPDGSLIFPIGADGIQHIQHASGAIQSRDPKTGLSTWKIPEGPIVVEYVYANDSSKTIHREEYDTILQATGRTACVEDLNLHVAGVRVANGKILVDDAETTTANHIYAIGDVATGVKQHLPEHHVKHALIHSRDRPELTPVAIQAGIHWARRVFGGAKDLMAYHLIPTTVFTPDEYAFTGLTQEEAERDEKDGGIGAENVEVFWSRYGSLEISPQHPPIIEPRSRHFIDQNFYPRIYAEQNKLWWPETGFDVDSNSSILLDNTSTGLITSRYQSSSGTWIYDVTLDDGSVVKEVSGNRLRINPTLAQDEVEVFMKANCLAKLICDKRRNNLVVGIHYIGPNAGEIMQGFALGLQLGATKQHFDKLVGIHPTAAEEFTVLTVTKSSGASYFKKAGCGGGSCG